MKKNTPKLVCIRLVIILGLIFSFIVLFQDFFVLPSLLSQYFSDLTPSKNATEEILDTPSRMIHLWKYSNNKKSKTKKIAIYFGGNWGSYSTPISTHLFSK